MLFMRVFVMLALLAHQQTSQAAPLPPDSSAEAAAPTATEFVSFQLRNGSTTTTKSYDPSKLALLVIDVWSWHWCKTCTARIGSMIPRINGAVAAGRKAGMTVMWSPTDVLENYDGWPQREKAINYPKVPPVFVRNSSIPETGLSPFGGPCMCTEEHNTADRINAGEMRMDTDLVIAESDFIVGGGTVDEVYSILKGEGIETVIYMGFAENICVQGKAEGMINMQKLGLDFILARDITDAYTGYDQTNPDKINPDLGTALVTDFIEQKGIALTTEFGPFAVAQGTWKSHLDPTLIAPWGTATRPYTVDFNGTVVVRVSTPCNCTTTCEGVQEWAKAGRRLSLVYTLDGSAPQPPELSAPIVSGPINIPLHHSEHNASGAPHLGVLLRVVAFAVDPAGNYPPVQVFAESNGTYVFRPYELLKVGPQRSVLVPQPQSAPVSPPALLSPQTTPFDGLLMADAPIHWEEPKGGPMNPPPYSGHHGSGSQVYRRVPTPNRSYAGLPFLAGTNTSWPLKIRDTTYLHGLGCWAPMHISYNLSALRQRGLARFVAQVGIDEAYCNRNNFFAAPWMCHDVVEFASAIVTARVDGVIVQQTPVLRMQDIPWPFDIDFRHTGKMLRLEVLRGPVLQGGRKQGYGYAVNQDSYDLVDFVEAAFVPAGYKGQRFERDGKHDHVHRRQEFDGVNGSSPSTTNGIRVERLS